MVLHGETMIMILTLIYIYLIGVKTDCIEMTMDNLLM